MATFFGKTLQNASFLPLNGLDSEFHLARVKRHEFFDRKKKKPSQEYRVAVFYFIFLLPLSAFLRLFPIFFLCAGYPPEDRL